MKPVSYSNIVLLKLARRIELGQITFEKATKYMSELDKTKLKDFCKGYNALGQSLKLNAFVDSIDTSLIKLMEWAKLDRDRSVQIYIKEWLDEDEKVIFQQVIADVYTNEDQWIRTLFWRQSLSPLVTTIEEANKQVEYYSTYESTLLKKQDEQKALDRIKGNISAAGYPTAVHSVDAYYAWGLSLIHDLIGGQF